MDFRILGPLELSDERGPVALPGARQRGLLALLLIRANEVVPSDLLIEELWGGHTPRNAANALQAAVSRVRKAIGGGRLRSHPPGYALEVGAGELDRDSFELLVAEGRASLARADAAAAAASLNEALALWRGPALADLAYESFAQSEIVRLDELRLTALEDRIEADLLVGRHAAVVGELRSLVAGHPLRERLRAELMLALYRSGRQAEALECYQAGRRASVDELGIEPTRELRGLESAILRQDAALDLASPSRPARADLGGATAPGDDAGGAERTSRKLVTVVFTDVVESTTLAEGLDPERLRGVMERYFAAMSQALHRHGGRIEKYVGDAVMAVFGVPVAHEDDALRALRAAAEMRGRLAGLNAELERDLGASLEARTGVNTGEVVVGGPSGSLVTGRAVNVAKRLEEAARPGEILLGEETFGHARGAARCEEAGRMTLKGLRAPVRAWRLVDVGLDSAPARGTHTAFVGREAERDRLLDAFERSARAGSCALVTVLGQPGIGKSRLVRETVNALAGRARTLRGHCLPYGEGITYWPLAEVVRQLAGEDPRAGLSELLAGDELGELATERVAAAAGAGGGAASPEETQWAFRRLLEALAAERPTVVVMDNVHWAEPTFLDLLEYVAGFAAGPLLVVCMGREDLLERRASWALARGNRELLQLEPLSDPDSHRLLELLDPGTALGADARAGIVEVASGNPLFLEQLVAAQVDEAAPGGAGAVPPTIQALLASRIDRLPTEERRVVERGAVEGRVFHRNALLALTPPEERETLGASLMALVRRDLIAPGYSHFPGDDAFRFGHLLIRDAAYGSLPKETRADLHERFAGWLELTSGGTVFEHDEIAGYHLEQAYRYRSELGLGAEEERRAVAARAADRLDTAARRAVARNDLHAAGSLLGRAADVLPVDDPRRSALLAELGAVLTEAGRLEEAERVLRQAIESGGGDARLAAHAHVQELFLGLQVGPAAAIAAFDDAREASAAVFERERDELGLCRLARLEGLIHWLRGQAGSAETAWERAAVHARSAGNDRERVDALAWTASAAFQGPIPAMAGIRRCEEIRRQVAFDRYAEAGVLQPLAGLYAMAGRFDVARRLLDESEGVRRELGHTMHSAVSHHEAFIALLEGEPQRAEAGLREGLARLREMGEKALLSTTAALLAQALVAQGRHAEAASFVDLAEEEGAADDLSVQIDARSVRARILAERGDLQEAETTARAAVELADRTDWLNTQADVRLDLAAVLRASGRPGDVAATLAAATERYARKGNVVGVERSGAVLDRRPST